MSDKERADRATELLRRLHGYNVSIGMKHYPDCMHLDIDAFLNPAPDFGEPWDAARGERIEDRSGMTVINSCFSEDHRARVIACVNACAGMRDPSAEIAALRAAANKTTTGPT